MVEYPDGRRELELNEGHAVHSIWRPGTVLTGDYIPFYLATKEFFELARARLAPGGAVIINVGHPADWQRLEQVLTATMRTALPHVVREEVCETNMLLVGSTARASRERLVAAARRLHTDLQPVALADARRLEGGTVHTDDKAPVEWLVDKSLIDHAGGDG